jgi:hypothetical protein
LDLYFLTSGPPTWLQLDVFIILEKILNGLYLSGPQLSRLSPFPNISQEMRTAAQNLTT